MFDIGFLEILIIMVIALAVIGPERLPEVARKIGALMGKTKRFVNTMKDNAELQDTVKELKQSIDIEAEKKQIQEMTHTLESDLNSLDHAAQSKTDKLEDGSNTSNSQQLQADSGFDDLEFERPFGGDSTQTTRSQFNKAPQQPKLPEPQTEVAAVNTETNPVEPDASTPNKATNVSESK